MPTLRCTQKLLKAGGLQLTDSHSTESDSSLDWYVNLLWIERKKCLLFSGATTLYAFLVPDVKKAHIQKLDIVFRDEFAENLQYEGYDETLIAQTLSKYSDLAIGRATDRKVLGSMNDYAFQFKFLIERAGGLEQSDILLFNHQVSDSPMSAIGYSDGLRELRKQMIQAVV